MSRKILSLTLENHLLEVEKKLFDTERNLLKEKLFPSILDFEKSDHEEEGESEGDVAREDFDVKQLKKLLKRKRDVEVAFEEERKEFETRRDEIVKEEVEKRLTHVMKIDEMKKSVHRMLKVFKFFVDDLSSKEKNELLKQELEISNNSIEAFESEIKKLSSILMKVKSKKIFEGKIREVTIRKLSKLLADQKEFMLYKKKWEKKLQEEFEAKQSIYKNGVLLRENAFLKGKFSLLEHKVLPKICDVYPMIEHVLWGKIEIKKWKRVFKHIVKDYAYETNEERIGISSMYYLLFLWNEVYHNISCETFQEKIWTNGPMKERFLKYRENIEQVFTKFMKGKEPLTYDFNLENLITQYEFVFSESLPKEEEEPKEPKEQEGEEEEEEEEHEHSNKGRGFCVHSLYYLIYSLILKQSTFLPINHHHHQQQQQQQQKEDEECVCPSSMVSLLSLFRSEVEDFVYKKKKGFIVVKGFRKIETLKLYFTFLDEGKTKTKEEWKEMEDKLFVCLDEMRVIIRNTMKEFINRRQESSFYDDEENTFLKKKEVSKEESKKYCESANYFNYLKNEYTFVLNENEKHAKAKIEIQTLTKKLEDLKKKNEEMGKLQKQNQNQYTMVMHTQERIVKRREKDLETLIKENERIKKELEESEEEKENQLLFLKDQELTIKSNTKQIQMLKRKKSELDEQYKNPVLDPRQLILVKRNEDLKKEVMQAFEQVLKAERKNVNEEVIPFLMDLSKCRKQEIEDFYKLKDEVRRSKKKLSDSFLELEVLDLSSIPKRPDDRSKDLHVEKSILQLKKNMQSIRKMVKKYEVF